MAEHWLHNISVEIAGREAATVVPSIVIQAYELG
jgi:hypothetical protein